MINTNKKNIFVSNSGDWIGIYVTKKALHQISYLMKNAKEKNIKISIKKSGCAGFRYNVEVYKKKSDFDYIVFSYKYINIYVLIRDVKILDGIVVDYVKIGLNSNFSFHNSREVNRCGCGSSFYI